MQVSTHNQDTPAANKQHKIEDQLPEYFNHGRILAPLAGIIPDLLYYCGDMRDSREMLFFFFFIFFFYLLFKKKRKQSV